MDNMEIIYCVNNSIVNTRNTKEHNNRQNVNIYIRNLDTNKER